MMVASSIFFAALAGIVALFGLKIWEERSMRTLLPRFRALLDSGAVKCKLLLIRAEDMFIALPSVSAQLALSALAFSAIGFARLARTASEAAHQLADFVSHKRNFERRETRSEFLKQVIEHKNGLNGNGVVNGGGKKKARRTVENGA